MAQYLTEDFITTPRPGAYFKQSTKSTPVGVAVSGNVVIIGEAEGGSDYSSVSLRDNWFGPSEVDLATRQYLSGPIVDAIRSLSTPSADEEITGSVSRIYIAKTNTSAQASSTIASYGTFKDKNFGVAGNKYFYQITEAAAEVAPSYEGDTIANFAVLSGVEFAVRINGEVVTSLDVFTGAAGDYDTIAEVAALIDAALPVGMSCSVGSGTDNLKFDVDVDASANVKGWGKSFELVEVNGGDLAALGLSAGLYVSSQEPKVQADIKRVDTGLNESFIVEAAVALKVGYEGTTATLSITDTTFSTTVTGGAGSSFSVSLADYATIKDLADYISAQVGYSASVSSAATSSSPSQLEKVTAIGICSSDSDLEAGRVKKAAYDFAKKVNESVALSFTSISGASGLPASTSVVYLTGGLRGATTAATIASVMTALESIDVNFVLPLFSRDASEDIAEGLTDSSSTYTILATNVLVKNHVLKMSTAKIKKHRSAVVSIWGSYQDSVDMFAAMSSSRIAVAFQKSSQVNSVGQTVSFLPWHTACIAAGMQCAGFYKPIVQRLANVISFTDPVGFDSGNPDNIEAALIAGGLFLEQDIAGNRWVSDQTSYVQDTNFVYNSLQAVYAADLVSLDLTASFQRAYAGKSVADVDASTGLQFLQSKMDSYKKQKLITASDDAVLGYKNAAIRIAAPVMSVKAEIKLSTGIYFIPIDLEFSQVTSSATA